MTDQLDEQLMRNYRTEMIAPNKENRKTTACQLLCGCGRVGISLRPKFRLARVVAGGGPTSSRQSSFSMLRRREFESVR